MNEHTLKFQNPVFRDGLNVTVRDGTKWMDRVKAGDEIGIADVVSSEPWYRGRVRAIRTCCLGEVTLGELWIQHDPDCILPAGLRASLEALYGRKFSLLDPVTVIAFSVLGGSDD